MMIALLALSLIQSDLPYEPMVRDNVPLEGARSGAGRGGVRGYRMAERIFADATDIRSNRARYSRRIVGRAQRSACPRSDRCGLRREFPISVNGKTIVDLAIRFRLSGSGTAACADSGGDDSCEIQVYTMLAGDEAFPHCIGAEPVRRAALRHGWLSDPWRHGENNSERYRRADDPHMRLFLRPLRDSRCVGSIWMVRIVAPPPPPRRPASN